MTTLAWLLLIVSIVGSGVDLWSLAEGRRDIEQLVKPGSTLVLALALAAAVGDVPGRWWAVIGFVCAAGGDYLLFANRFLQGVVAFAAAQVALVVALTQRSPRLVAAVIGLGVVVVLLSELGRPVLAAARAAGPSLSRAVHAYFAAIGTMVAMGFASRSPMAAFGASVFAASDGLVAWRRLIGAEPWMALAGRALYRVGLVCLALSFA